VERILDFASGYGCVSRHFKNVMPSALLTAMDIHENAYHFNKMHFGVDAIVSSVDPTKQAPHIHLMWSSRCPSFPTGRKEILVRG
jgi:hypothetical protein